MFRANAMAGRGARPNTQAKGFIGTVDDRYQANLENGDTVSKSRGYSDIIRQFPRRHLLSLLPTNRINPSDVPITFYFIHSNTIINYHLFS